jgi:hypothetical protein
MYRLVLLCCAAMAVLVSRAQALEMFTSFHNGQNVGFPSLEVPTKFYGHGGWQQAAQCRPERVWSIEPVPAMTPTGRAAVTPTGFIRRDRGRKGNGMPHGDNQQSADQQSANPPGGDPQANGQPHDNQTQYVSDRRRSWNGGNDNWAGYNQPYSESESSDSSQTPTPAKVAPKSDGWTRSLEQAPADNSRAKRPTSVFAHPGSPPRAGSVNKAKTNTGQASDQRSQSAQSTSSRNANDDSRSVVPPQPTD